MNKQDIIAMDIIFDSPFDLILGRGIDELSDIVIGNDYDGY